MLLPRLIARVRTLGNTTSQSKTANLIAFSGGVDSSVVAALVHRAFPRTSTAVLGVSNAVHTEQIHLARHVASFIGIPLHEVNTQEGIIPEYIENSGNACFYCRTELYKTLKAVGHLASTAAAINQDDDQNDNNNDDKVTVLFNGTNGDDKQDPTRVGLIAADNFSVASPLFDLTKDEVRQVARLLELPNHAHAASPCLRSRLALGVEATASHLQAVEMAERTVRNKLQLNVESNLRVRLLSGGRSALEIDSELLESVDVSLANDLKEILKEHGFEKLVLRPFQSGSVNGVGTTGIKEGGMPVLLHSSD